MSIMNYLTITQNLVTSSAKTIAMEEANDGLKTFIGLPGLQTSDYWDYELFVFALHVPILVILPIL